MKRHDFVEVVVAEADGRFHYRLPLSFGTKPLEAGVRLLVPFGRGWKVAYFIRTVEQPDVSSTKEVLAVLDETSLIGPSLFKQLLWISDYYFAPLGAVIKGALPQGIHAAPRRRFDLTERGREAKEERKTEVQKRLIEILLEEGPLTEPQLRKKIGKPPASPLLALKKKGWIQERWEIDPAPVQKKYRRIISLKPPSPEIPSLVEGLEKRAPQQANLLKTLVSAGGALPAAAFEGPLRAPLKRLLEKGLLEQTDEVAHRLPRRGSGFGIKGEIVLNEAQRAAAEEMIAALEKGTFSPFLLRGVTGSGKTEVYLRVIEKALERKRGAILLVPEIALTAQLVARFHSRFGEAVALLHSGLSAGERYDEWRRIEKGEARLAIGVRSAIFAPLQEVGVIIVDEEHDTSYKQEEGVRYHARDLALVRGKESGAVVVLGSATPSFESFFNSQTGKYRPLHLPGRIDDRPLPAVHRVDLRDKGLWVRPFLTAPLISAIEKRLAASEQVLLFINRRGFSPSILCGDCGYLPHCVRCSVSLTFHKKIKSLVCHYCGFQIAPPTGCPECKGVRLIHLGVGAEQVEEEIRALFPKARLARMDRDTTRKKGSGDDILAAMARRDIDILIGTQMIAKGHDFPGVTLVGVLCADLSLHFPDFRSSERTFQILAQVAGRAGRGDRPGEVIIQTFQPEHEAILAAATQDYLGFFQREIVFREEIGYPPFSRLTLLLFSHRDETRVADRAEALSSLIRKSAPGRGVELLGPAPAPIVRLRGDYRYQILLKGKEQKKIAAVLKRAIRSWRTIGPKGVRLEVIVDPQNFV